MPSFRQQAEDSIVIDAGQTSTQPAGMSSTGVLSRISRVAGRLAGPFVDLVLPSVCAFCGEYHQPSDSLEFNRDSIRLCNDCVGSFLKDTREACHRCGRPVGPYSPDTTAGCVICRPTRQRYKEVIRIGTYDDELRTACIRSKSRGSEPLAAALGDLLFCEQRERLQAIDADVIVPVPQHWLHWFTRPHHSALTVGDRLSKHLQIPLRDGLVHKVRHTADQSGLNRASRLKNLHRAFRVSPLRRVAGKRILVVDDILTTGSTANEMSRALRTAGAKHVAVAVIVIVR